MVTKLRKWTTVRPPTPFCIYILQFTRCIPHSTVCQSRLAWRV